MFPITNSDASSCVKLRKGDETSRVVESLERSFSDDVTRSSYSFFWVWLYQSNMDRGWWWWWRWWRNIPSIWDWQRIQNAKIERSHVLHFWSLTFLATFVASLLQYEGFHHPFPGTHWGKLPKRKENRKWNYHSFSYPSSSPQQIFQKNSLQSSQSVILHKKSSQSSLRVVWRSC